LLNEIILEISQNHPYHGQNGGYEITEVRVLSAKQKKTQLGIGQKDDAKH